MTQEQKHETIYLRDVSGFARQTGTDDNGAVWEEFEVDHMAEQETGECSICGAKLESGWLCLDDGSQEVCSSHVEVMTVQSAARRMADAFETRIRKSNEEEFITLKDGSPEWMTEAAHTAHENMLPDDWRYQFILEACEAIAEASDPDDMDAPEPDCYNADLMRWAASHPYRFSGYADDALTEIGGEDFMAIVSYAQYLEKADVRAIVLEALRQVVTP